MVFDAFKPELKGTAVKGGSPTSQVDQFHLHDDADVGPDAHHHTLGFRPGQAAAGDHSHNTLTAQSGASANLNPPNANTDIAGTAFDFESKKTSDIWMVLTSWDITVVGTGTFIGRCLVDGVQLPAEGILIGMPVGSRIIVSQTQIITGLQKGIHHIKLTGLSSAGVGNYTVQSTHTRITLVKING